jgi:Fe2+ transport system protein FeoA
LKTTEHRVPLASLAVDSCARFHCAELDCEARDLLRGLGLTDGACMRVCQRGETCIVQVRGTRIGITNRVARSIHVEPIAAALAQV